MDNHVGQKLINIVVTGTPGVGKTSFSALLADRLNDYLLQNQQSTYHFTCYNLGKLINEKHLYKDWNKEFDVPEFDEDMVCDELEPSVNEGGVIIDFHSPGFLPEEWVDLVVLLRCNNTILYDRLKARGYVEKKITENIDCEIMEVTADVMYGEIRVDDGRRISSDQRKKIYALIKDIADYTGHHPDPM